VQIQLCEFCLKSGMLCSKCQRKVESGEVSEKYMEVAKALLEMEGQNQFLQKVRLDNVLDSGGYLVLVVGKGDAAKFQAEPRLTRDLGDRFNRRVLVIESGTKDRQFLEDLFANQHIMTINIIWLPDGSTETRVVLQGRGSRRLSKKRLQALTSVAKSVRKMDLRVEYTY
jgi:transcription antitermination factor NusA-like protein